MSHHEPVARRIPQALAIVCVLAFAATGCTDSAESDAPAQSSHSGTPSASQSGAAQSGAASTSSASPSSTQDPEAEEAAATSPIQGEDWTQSASSQTRDPIHGTAGDGLVFHAMRVAEHEGFYRVVLEFAGTGAPGWNMSWSDQPVEQGRGLPLEVAGVAFLDLVVTGTAMPTAQGQQDQYYSGPASLQVGPVDVVEDGTFEDQTHVVIGLDDVRDFQIGALEDPARVVVDIRK